MRDGALHQQPDGQEQRLRPYRRAFFYQEIGDEEGVTFSGNLGLGAMSNAFDIHAPTPERRSELISEHWWAGDNLARSANYNYNGFNVPNTDKQDNPTHGTCWTVRQDGGLQGGTEPPCTGAQSYVEPASGFWIINPATNLIGNSIAGCQGVGRGYWYVPPKDGAPDALSSSPSGSSRTTACTAATPGCMRRTSTASAPTSCSRMRTGWNQAAP